MRPELPIGTVTFLFTDVEGSTSLLHELGAETYADALSGHHAVIRNACLGNGGVEVDTQGDAFFYVFPRAHGAAEAAVETQRALSAHTWPEEVDVRVRIGMHTGEPAVTEQGYHGLGVHRAARIMATGHGGQMLLSQATASVLSDD